MIRTRAASLTHRAALVLACLACAALIPATPALAAAESTITYQHESLAEFEKQLASGKIESVVFNKVLRSLRVTLKDGTHVLAKYGKGEQPKVKRALEAKGVPVSILSPSQARKEAKKSPPKHKLRYIAGGILIVVVIIVGGVLVIDRKRKAQRD